MNDEVRKWEKEMKWARGEERKGFLRDNYRLIVCVFHGKEKKRVMEDGMGRISANDPPTAHPTPVLPHP